MAEENKFAPEFPEAIPLCDLEKNHSEYNAAKLNEYDALYEGGDKFKELIDTFLIRLQMEEQEAWPVRRNPLGVEARSTEHGQQEHNLEIAELQYKSRKKRAWYAPLVPGVIDFMVAAVCQNQPSIVATSGQSSDKNLNLFARALEWIRGQQAQSEVKYWNDINRNADGMGMDLGALGTRAIRAAMLHKRAYLGIRFPKGADVFANFGQAEAAGMLNATITLLHARNVNDWKEDAYGKLEWVRTCYSEKRRPLPWQQPSIIVKTWTFITAQASYVYEYAKKEGDPVDVPVRRLRFERHGLGELPVIPINSPVWVMERLRDIAVALFNRQVALEWHLDKTAYAMLTLFTDKQIDQVVTDLALVLNKGDAAQVTSPPAQTADALQKDIDRLKEEMFLAVQAMVLMAAAKDEQGRQSGVAKQRDFGSLSTLLSAFAAPLRDALEQAIRIIKKVRKEESLPVSVQGLDKFDVQSLELKLKNAASALNLDLPKTARKWIKMDTALAACADAPPEVREGIVTEIINEPDDGSMGALDNSDIRQSNTQIVKPVADHVGVNGGGRRQER